MKPPDRLSPVPWALAFCLIALAITATGYLSYQSYRQHFRANQASQLSAIADLKVSELTSWRTERANNARVLVTNPEFAALVERFLTSSEDSESMRRLLAWLNVERQAYGYDRVYLTDLQGSPLLFSPIETLPDSSTAAAYIPDALRARQVVFVDFYRNTRQQIRLSLLAPVYAGLDPSRPLGIVVFDIDPQIDLYPYISRWPIPSDTAETLIIRKDGGDTLFLNNLRFNPTAALSLRVPLTKTNVPSVRAALGDTGSMEGSDYRGVAVLAELRTVPGSPWFLVARVDLTELYQPLNERLWQTLAFFGMLIIGSALGLGLVWRQQSLHFYRERYLTAQALEQSEARFRTLVEQAPTAILIQSGTRFTYVNQAGVHLFGAAQPQQITGQPAAERFLANAQARIQQHLDQLNEQPGVPAVLEESITRLDGSRREVELSAARVTINNEPAALVFLQDISQRKQAEALLKEYNARLEHEVQQRTLELQSAQEKLLRQEKLAVLGQLAGSIGHELRNPLGVISNAVSFLKMIQTDAPAKVKEYLEIIAGETRRSDKIVTDLLEFTRTRAAAREAVPLAPLIGKVIARYPLPEGLALQLDLPENLPLIYVDPRQMEQVLGNLVTNGFQAVTARTDLPPGQGALRISAVPNGEHIQIQVQDNGVGISAENLARIFEPLFTTKTRGFGLGLTVCQKLVEANAGAIRAESRPGEGSCFTIELPISKERP